MIFALPAFFFAEMVNVASPLASVFLLVDKIDMNLLPDGAIFAVTVSPSTGQPSSPVIFTVTSLLAFLLSLSLVGDTTIEVATHTGVAVDIGVTEGVDMGVAVDVAVVVIVGDAVGVTEGEGVGVVIAEVMSKLESRTLDDPS